MLIATLLALALAVALFYAWVRKRNNQQQAIAQQQTGTGSLSFYGPSSIYANLECSTKVVVLLQEHMREYDKDRRKLRKAFKQTLSEHPWRWPWLEEYPDTPGDPAELLADTLVRSRQLVKKSSNINSSLSMLPYLIIKAVGDTRDFPECKADNKTILQAGAKNRSIILPHRPGCRCYVYQMSERMLKNRGLLS